MRAVVTVTGTDRTGVVYHVSGLLYRHNVNIEDVSQTILGDQFAMMMMVDISQCTVGFSALAEALQTLGEEIGMNIRIQHEGLFDAMHNV